MKNKNPHWRERWTIFALIYASVWFASLKQLSRMPSTTDVLSLMLITVFSSGLVYFLIGRIIFFFWWVLMQFGSGWMAGKKQAAENRSKMRDIAAKLALEPTPVQGNPRELRYWHSLGKTRRGTSQPNQLIVDPCTDNRIVN